MSGSGVVTFDYGVWATRYPEFVPNVSLQLAQLYFAEATLYVDNTGSGPIQNAGQLAAILNMVTAHIAALNQAGSSPLVGRISDASEGSVHVAVAYDAAVGSQAWYAQTKYGAAAWQAMAAFRRFNYLPAGRPGSFPYPLPGRRFW